MSVVQVYQTRGFTSVEVNPLVCLPYDLFLSMFGKVSVGPAEMVVPEEALIGR